jgi:HEAT repeat protein
VTPKLATDCFDEVVSNLTSADEYVRRQIVENLISAKAPALLSLVEKRLDDPSEAVRIAAALNESIPINDKVRKILTGGMVYGIDEQDLFTLSMRFGSAVRLAEAGDRKAIAFLHDSAKEREPNLRLALATEIAETSDKRLLPCAMSLLSDDSQWVVIGAATAATQMGKAEELKKLRFLVDSPEPNVAGIAAEGLAAVGDRESIPQIRKLLRANDPLTRIHAAKSLILLGDPGGKTAMRRIVRTLRNDNEWGLAVSALQSVGECRDISTIDDIIRQSDDPQIRRAACVAAVEIWHRAQARQAELKGTGVKSTD